ncbi:MAG TPA: hypothetical protein VGG49_10900 [Steroidobacteraceae bacterium]
MKTEDPREPTPDTRPEDERTGDEPNPPDKKRKDSQKSELGGAKN